MEKTVKTFAELNEEELVQFATMEGSTAEQSTAGAPKRIEKSVHELSGNDECNYEDIGDSEPSTPVTYPTRRIRTGHLHHLNYKAGLYGTYIKSDSDPNTIEGLLDKEGSYIYGIKESHPIVQWLHDGNQLDTSHVADICKAIKQSVRVPISSKIVESFVPKVHTDDEIIKPLEANIPAELFNAYGGEILELANVVYFRGIQLYRMVDWSHPKAIEFAKRLMLLSHHRDQRKERQAQEVSPSEGGCWFCRKGETDTFDSEFDTYLHLDCLKKTLKEEPDHPEAVHMRYLIER